MKLQKEISEYKEEIELADKNWQSGIISMKDNISEINKKIEESLEEKEGL